MWQRRHASRHVGTPLLLHFSSVAAASAVVVRWYPAYESYSLDLLPWSTIYRKSRDRSSAHNEST
jgi:hypothetical protein